MKRWLWAAFLALVLALGSSSCAILAESMTPAQVASTLPGMTRARFVSISQAEDAVNGGRARLLARREYAAPVGMSVRRDLRNGAEGIDGWVELDGGNAYVLVNYRWERVDEGVTQLFVEFDTLLFE